MSDGKNNISEESINKKIEKYQEAFKILDNLIKKFPTDPTKEELEILQLNIADNEEIIKDVAANLSQWEKLKKKNIKLPSSTLLINMIESIKIMKQRISKFMNEFNELLGRETEITDVKLSEVKKNTTERSRRLQENMQMEDFINQSIGTSRNPTTSELFSRQIQEQNKYQTFPKSIFSHSTPYQPGTGTRFVTAPNITPEQSHEKTEIAQLKEQVSQLTNLIQNNFGWMSARQFEQQHQSTSNAGNYCPPRMPNREPPIVDAWYRPMQMPPIDYSRTFKIKEVEYIPKFDGKARNFKSFIKMFSQVVGVTPISDEYKIMLLKQKLDEYSQGIILGAEEYKTAYARLVKEYCDPTIIQEDVMKEIEAIPPLMNVMDSKQMRKNLGIIQHRYEELKNDPVHQQFLERNFFLEICKKFPQVIADRSNEYTGRPERINQYLKDAEMFIDGWRYMNKQPETTKSRINRNIRSETIIIEEIEPNSSTTSRNRIQSTTFTNRFNQRRNVNNVQRNNSNNQNQRAPFTGRFGQQRNVNTAPRNNSNNQNRRAPFTGRFGQQGNVNITSRDNNNFQNNNETKVCRICDQLHSSRNCPLTIEERKQEILRKRLCYKCLSHNHITKDCPMKMGCYQCGGSHSYLICYGESIPTRNFQINQPQIQYQQPNVIQRIEAAPSTQHQQPITVQRIEAAPSNQTNSVNNTNTEVKELILFNQPQQLS